MKKRARGQRPERGRGARPVTRESSARDVQAEPAPEPPPPPPVLMSITPDGVRLPEGQPGPSAEAARLRRDLERHAQDVEQFVRAKRFDAIVTRVLADIERACEPPLRLRPPD